MSFLLFFSLICILSFIEFVYSFSGLYSGRGYLTGVASVAVPAAAAAAVTVTTQESGAAAATTTSAAVISSLTAGPAAVILLLVFL